MDVPETETHAWKCLFARMETELGNAKGNLYLPVDAIQDENMYAT